MNIELICWIASWILVSEGLFIFFLKNKDCIDWFKDSGFGWIIKKVCALLCGAVFIFVQLLIVTDDVLIEAFTSANFHYINILYEFLIILGLIIFFFINKKIADKINGKK